MLHLVLARASVCSLARSLAPTVSRTAESSGGASNGVPDTIAALYRLPVACQASLRRSLGRLVGERLDHAMEESVVPTSSPGVGVNTISADSSAEYSIARQNRRRRRVISTADGPSSTRKLRIFREVSFADQTRDFRVSSDQRRALTTAKERSE